MGVVAPSARQQGGDVCFAQSPLRQERSPFANDSVSLAQLLELRAAAALRRRDHLLVLVDRVPDRLAPQPRVASNDRRREDGNQLGLPVLGEPRREAASDGALGLGIQEDGHVFESTHLGVSFSSQPSPTACAKYRGLLGVRGGSPPWAALYLLHCSFRPIPVSPWRCDLAQGIWSARGWPSGQLQR